MAAPIAIGAADALVSNINGCKAVPVRPDSYRDRLWVLETASAKLCSGFFVFEWKALKIRQAKTNFRD